MNKSVKDLSTEDLIKSLETTEDGFRFRETGISSDVMGFCNVFRLIPGDDEVKVSTLYAIYETWSKKPLPLGAFSKQISLAFKGNNGIALIDEESFTLDRSEWVHFVVTESEKKNNLILKNKFDKFIKTYRLERGENYVHVSKLYELHRAEPGLKKEMKLKQFTMIAELYLDMKSTRHGKYFGVSDSVWDHIIKEDYEKEEKNKKKSKKTRST